MDKEKRVLTKEEILFLKNLQFEMNTQNINKTRGASYWGIKDIKQNWDVREDDAEGRAIWYDNGWIEDFQDFIKSLKKEFWKYDDEVKIVGDSENTNGLLKLRIVDKRGKKPIVYRYSEEKLEDLVLGLIEDGIVSVLDYKIRYYNWIFTVCENAFFLTEKDCIAHLESCHLYTKLAYPVEMKIHRSREVEQLFDILENVDFEKIAIS